MITLPSAVRIFLCTRPTDMRKSFDGLTGLVQECFGQDPLTGHLFLFLNCRRDCLKILYSSITRTQASPDFGTRATLMISSSGSSGPRKRPWRSSPRSGTG